MEVIFDNNAYDMSENRGNKTHFNGRQIYTVSA